MNEFSDFSHQIQTECGVRIPGSHVKSLGLNNYRNTRARNFVIVFPESL